MEEIMFHDVWLTTPNDKISQNVQHIVYGCKYFFVRNIMVAGGMESLSNSPYTLARGDTPYGGINLKDSCQNDALTDAYSNWHMGK